MDGVLKVQLAQKIDLTKDGSVTMGKTVVNNDGLKITNDGADETKNVTINGDKVSFGGIQVNNMGSGASSITGEGDNKVYKYDVDTNGANIGDVKKIAGITQEDSSLLSYLYQNAVSPHLAARIEGNPVDPETVKADFDRVKKEYDYVTVEGSGGIVCPIRWDEEHEILLEDIVKMLHLNTLVIADAGLGTINAVVLTVEYVRNHGMDVKGIILNHYSGGAMQEDNEKMIERLTGVPVIARVRDGARELEVDLEVLKRVYD